MVFYIFPYLYILLLTLYFYKKIKIQSVDFKTLLILILPACLVAILRGNVGTDTSTYLNFFRDYKFFGNSLTNFEPGFAFFAWLFSLLDFNERFSVACIGTLTTLILCKNFSKSKEEMLLFGLILFPIYYVDFTMNGIRYGLGFTLSAVSVDALYDKKYKKTLFYSILAFLIHFSSILVIVPFLMNYLKRKYWVIVIMLLCIFVIVFPNIFDLLIFYFDKKEYAYSLYYSPNNFSGVAPLLLTILFHLNFTINTKKKNRSSLIHLILIAEVVSFLIARYSYAGLRLQGAFMFAMILFLKNNWQFIQHRKRNLQILAIISLLAFLISIKNISSSLESDSPFLPYTFFWDEKY